jgi:hypothetical protein
MNAQFISTEEASLISWVYVSIFYWFPNANVYYVLVYFLYAYYKKLNIMELWRMRNEIVISARCMNVCVCDK